MQPENMYYTPQIDPEQDAQRVRRMKRLLLLIVLIPLAVIAAYFIFRQVTAASLIITTNSEKNNITVVASSAQSINDDESAPAANPTELKNNIATKLKPGTYIVTVTNDTSSKSQTVQLHTGKTSKYTINLNTKTPASPEVVANANTLQFSVTNSAITYVNNSDSALYSINKSNTIKKLYPKITFATIKWADPNYGIARDLNSRSLYIIDHGTVKSFLPKPLKLTDSSVVSIDSNRDIYIGLGKDIYKGTPTTDFKHFYTAANTPTLIMPMMGKLAINSYNGNGDTQSTSSVTIVSPDGKGTRKRLEAYDLAWSPSGKYLMTTNDSNSQVFDSSFNPVTVVPNNNVNNLTWLNDDTILYSINDQLWRYDLKSSSSEVVAKALSGHSISFITFDPDHTYAYLSVQDLAGNNDSFSIERVSLGGQSSDSVASKLSGHFPQLMGSCYLQYLGFGSPATIRISGSTNRVDCTAIAPLYVQQFKVDPSSLRFVNSGLSVAQAAPTF